MALTDEQLLAEVEDTIRSMPPRETLRHQKDENFAWLGRVAAVVEAWNPGKAIILRSLTDEFHGKNAHDAQVAFRRLMGLLEETRHSLRMKAVGPLSAAVDRGKVFDYFDEVRKVIESASKDILFIDPYLDAEFVSRYLPHIRAGVSIRLLARERLATLLPAVDAFAKQTSAKVAVRSASGFHDRYAILDGTACYQSGASFKDGAKSSPTTLTQIVDAFPAVQKTYEDLWIAAKSER